MKVKVKADNRSEIDKRFDSIYNKMVRDAHLTPLQENIVATYLHKITQMRINEVEAAIEMSYLISLIESEHYGTDKKRAKKLPRVQAYAADVINEVFGHSCIDSAGFWNSYDGCGVERLKVRLERNGVDYDLKSFGG